MSKIQLTSGLKYGFAWHHVKHPGGHSLLIAVVCIFQNRRMLGVGRDLCGSSSPTRLPKQGHLQQAAQELVQAGF